MFEVPQLIGTPIRDIALDTRTRVHILNSQAADPDYQSIRADRRRLDTHRFWKPRKPISGQYNCYGLIWASRRTAIYEQSAIATVFREDGYRELGPAEQPLWGDVVLYFLTGTKSIIHAGIVSEVLPLEVMGSAVSNVTGASTIWILSKWGDASSEVLHQLQDVPWGTGEFTYLFWTDRPTIS